MRLTSLTLRNFRSFADATIAFEPGTVLVGANNAGKTTVIDALRFLLHGWEPEAATWHHSSFRTRGRASAPEGAGAPVLVVGRFGDLSQHEYEYWRTALDDEGCLELGAISTPDDFVPDRGISLAGRPNPYVVMPYERVPADFQRDPDGNLDGAGHVDGMAWVNPVSFWRYCTSGQDAFELGPTLVVVPGPTAPPAPVHSVLKPLVRSMLRAAPGGPIWQLQHEAMDITDVIAAFLDRAFEAVGGMQVRASPINVGPDGRAEELAAALVQFSLAGTEGGSPLGVGEPGGGAVRAATLAALDLYCQPSLWSATRSVILAVEEPEAGLHPALQRRLAATLRDLPARGVQTVITTHSATFMDAASPRGIRVVRRPGASPRISAGDDLSEVVAELGTRPSDVLLGEHFLIVEGQTEVVVLRAWSRTLGLDLDRAGVRIVSADGGDQVPVVARLATIAFPGALYTALVDGDPKGDAASRRLQTRQPDVRVIRWSRHSIESYYSVRAANLWAQFESMKQGVPPPPPASGHIDLRTLQGLAEVMGPRAFDKVGSGEFIAGQMTRGEIDAEVIAVFGEVLRRAPAAPFPEPD